MSSLRTRVNVLNGKDSKSEVIDKLRGFEDFIEVEGVDEICFRVVDVKWFC